VSDQRCTKGGTQQQRTLRILEAPEGVPRLSECKRTVRKSALLFRFWRLAGNIPVGTLAVRAHFRVLRIFPARNPFVGAPLTAKALNAQ
jgi:hypothetical protein